MDKIEQKAVLDKVKRNVGTLQLELSLDEVKTDPRTDIPDLLNTNPAFVKLLEIYYKADRLIEAAQEGMALMSEAINVSMVQLDKEILQEQKEKKYDLVYLSRDYEKRVLHIQERGVVRTICGTTPRGSVDVHDAKLSIDKLDPVGCILCSRALNRIIRENK